MGGQGFIHFFFIAPAGYRLIRISTLFFQLILRNMIAVTVPEGNSEGFVHIQEVITVLHHQDAAVIAHLLNADFCIIDGFAVQITLHDAVRVYRRFSGQVGNGYPFKQMPLGGSQGDGAKRQDDSQRDHQRAAAEPACGPDCLLCTFFHLSLL